MKRSTRYLGIAVILGGVGAIVLGVAIYKYNAIFGDTYSRSPADWGLFGDYLGGFAGTVITFLTLLALVVTVYLQAKELEETRKTLDDQSQAVRDYEERKIQPLIKAEWFKSDDHKGLDWRIRNVGLGPCILEGIDVWANGEKVGGHAAWYGEGDALEIWRQAFETAFGVEYPKVGNLVSLEPAHMLKVGLAPGEPQIMVRCKLTNTPAVNDIWRVVDQRLHTVIYFRTLTGELLDTEMQFERLRNPPI